MDPPLSPTAQAASLRARAATLSGAERNYFLWLAREWDKLAIRYGGPAKEAYTSHAAEPPDIEERSVATPSYRRG
jgi:hypothetical protein